MIHELVSESFSSANYRSFSPIILSYTSLHESCEPAATNMAHATASAIISSEAPCFLARSAWISVHRSHLMSTEAATDMSSFVRWSRVPSLYTEFLNSPNAFAISGVFSLNHDNFYSSFPLNYFTALLFIRYTLVKPHASCSSCNMHQSQHHRHLDKRSYNSGKCLTGAYPEYPNRHCDCKFKVVACSSECKCCGLVIGKPKPARHEKRKRKHYDEIGKQRQCYPENVHWKCNYVLSLQREHDDNGKKQTDQRGRTKFFHEYIIVPILSPLF